MGDWIRPHRIIMSVEKFRNIFNGLEERFGYHIIDKEEDGNGEKRSGRSFTSNYAHTIDMWKAHYNGESFEVKLPNNKVTVADSLGICPINKNSECTWGSVDLDDYKPDYKELFKKLESINVPMIPFKSKSGGIHVYIFLDKPVKALLLRDKLHSIKNVFGSCKPDKIFPVQKYIDLDKGSAGSWINLPYYKAEKTERYMIKENGEAATIQEFFAAYEKSKVSLSQLKKLKSNIDEGDSGEWFKEGPPCLQTLSRFGVEERQRNEVMLDMTRYVKLAHGEKWKEKTGDYNNKFFKPPLSYNEVNKVIESRDKKDYPYRCNQEWLKPHCNREQCMLRKHGVGGAGGNLDIALGPLSYVKFTPKTWYLGFNGEVVKLTSKELVRQDLAREQATEQTGKTPPKVKNWDLQIRTLQTKATPIDAPEESTPTYILTQSLDSFCFKMRRTTDKKKIIRGSPYYDKSKKSIYFQFDAFYKHLKLANWNISENDTHSMLKAIEGISRDKIHLEGNVKRWVYIVNEETFEKEDEIKQTAVEFPEPEF